MKKSPDRILRIKLETVRTLAARELLAVAGGATGGCSKDPCDSKPCVHGG